MAEKPESDEFDDEESDDEAGGEDSLDVDRLMQDLDKRKRGAARNVEEPAWRKLERLLEQKRTSELLSDFDDYDIGDGRGRAAKEEELTARQPGMRLAGSVKIARCRRDPSQPARQVHQSARDHVHHLPLDLQFAGHAHQP